MIQLTEFILEKLHVSKYKKERDLSDIDYEFVSNSLYFDDPSQEKKCYHLIQLKKSRNDYKSLVSTKEDTKLLRYWFASICRDWLKGAIEFRKELIKRGFKEDELDAYIISRYHKYNGFNDLEKNFEEYLDYYNVKYDKNEKL